MASLELDHERIRDLFDIRRRADGGRYVAYTEDLYPALHRLRESGPVHPGAMHELIGYEGTASFHGLPEHGRPHFSVFSFSECDAIYRDAAVFKSAPPGSVTETLDSTTNMVDAIMKSSMLTMNGPPHRRQRLLVQPSFVPAKARWWIENWIQETVDGLIDGFQSAGRAELNVDFCATIPMLTITGSFGLTTDEALDVRATLEGLGGEKNLFDFLVPIIARRRLEPKDDLISVLVQAEIQDEDGVTHVLTDEEILTFAFLLLSAGSGTTWKQMGIALTALLTNDGMVEEIREDRSLVAAAVEESLRWNITDPMFSRWVVEDTSLAGVPIPAGSVVHPVIGAANRDPARWESPDDYDIHRAPQPHLGFANGPHICLGQHVARAEMVTALNALLDRLPNLRLDADAEPPAIIGLYERGPSHIPAVWDPA